MGGLLKRLIATASQRRYYGAPLLFIVRSSLEFPSAPILIAEWQSDRAVLPPMRPHAYLTEEPEPVIVFDDAIRQVIAAVRLQATEAGMDISSSLLGTFDLIEAGKYLEAAERLADTPTPERSTVVFHLLCAITSLGSEDLSSFIVQEKALTTAQPSIAVYLSYCYWMAPSVRQTLTSLASTDIESQNAELTPIEEIAALLLMAKEARDSGQLVNSLKYLDLVVECAPEDVQDSEIRQLLSIAYFERAFCYSSQKDFLRAKEDIAIADRLEPNNSRILNEFGYISNQLGSYDEAIELYKRAQQADASAERTWTASAFRGIGSALIDKGSLEDAEQAFRNALDIDPANDTALSELRFIDKRRRELRGEGTFDNEFAQSGEIRSESTDDSELAQSQARLHGFEVSADDDVLDLIGYDPSHHRPVTGESFINHGATTSSVDVERSAIESSDAQKPKRPWWKWFRRMKTP